MRNKTFLAVLLLLITLPCARAQLYELERYTTDLYGKNSLIACWDGSRRIAYTEDSTGTVGYFVAETPNLTTPNRVQLPAGMLITDMDHYDDNLVFCGASGLFHHYGFIGIMNIPNTIETGQPISYFPLDRTVFTSTGDTFYNINPSKTVFFTDENNSNGYTYHAMTVCSCLMAPEPNASIPAPIPGHVHTTLCEAVYNNTNGWRYWIYYNPYEEIVYTDVTATENYIVAVGRDAETGRMIIKLFERHHYQALANPVSQHHLTEILEDGIGDMVLVEAMEGDQFASASYYSDGDVAGTTVKIFDITNGTAVPVISSHLVQNNSPQIPNTWHLSNLCYEKYYDRLYLLQEMDNPVSSSIVSAVQEYDATYFSTAPALITWKDIYELYDVTSWYAFGHEAIGNYNSRLTTYGKRAGHIAEECWNCQECSYSTGREGPSSIIRNEAVSAIILPRKHQDELLPVSILKETECYFLQRTENDDNEDNW